MPEPRGVTREHSRAAYGTDATEDVMLYEYKANKDCNRITLSLIKKMK